MDAERKISVAGNFRKRKSDVDQILFQDFVNPWTFHTLFMEPDAIIANWCVRNGLLAGGMPCDREGCGGQLKLGKRSGRPLGCTLRCGRNRDHEVSILKYSFFEKSKLDIRDIMEFIRGYLESHSLNQVARNAGMSYGGSAVDWGSFMRELFKEYFYRVTRTRKLKGVVELDESLFGRRVKYHKGDPTKGLKVWVFGMVERASNSIIMYPVTDRTSNTLVSPIQKHVEPDSTIYSDGFSSYCNLNHLGYRHFTVLHKYSFKKTYKNMETGETEIVHTNRIEGAWKHAQYYFRKMSGTKASQWEGHMAEIMWRSEFKSRVFRPFFELLQSVFNLRGPPQFTYPTPLFPSWQGAASFSQADMVEPAISAAESTDSEILELDAAEAVLAQDEPQFTESATITPGCLSAVNPKKKRINVRKMNLVSDLLDSSSGEENLSFRTSAAVSQSIALTASESNTTRHPRRKGRQNPKSHHVANLFASSSGEDTVCAASPSLVPEMIDLTASGSKTSVRKPPGSSRQGSDHVCCPRGFRQLKKEGKNRPQRTAANPYSKAGYIWGPEWSSDDDFRPQSTPKIRRKPRK